LTLGEKVLSIGLPSSTESNAGDVDHQVINLNLNQGVSCVCVLREWRSLSLHRWRWLRCLSML
jgi:hypothetical protein